MPPKKRRKENKGLPERWRWKNGKLRYLVPENARHLWDNKTEFTLGKTLTEAYQVWAKRMGEIENLTTISQAMDQYLLEILPKKSYTWQISIQIAFERLRPPFGKLPIEFNGQCTIQPKHAYTHYNNVKKTNGATAAKHDIQILRHLLTVCVEWGLTNRNPLIGQVRIENKPPRDRYVEQWEIIEALTVANERIACYIKFKLMTGLRRTDILSLKLNQIKDDGIHVQPSKTKSSSGKRLVIEWDEHGELEKLINAILAIKPRRIGNTYLFTTRQGKPYINPDTRIANAFDSLWQRFMKKVLEQTNVKQRFQERDLRAKTATDSDTLIEASERLGHASTETTKRVYRRKPTRIQPLLVDLTRKNSSKKS